MGPLPQAASHPGSSHLQWEPPDIFHAINNSTASSLQIKCCLTRPRDLCIPSASAKMCNYPWVIFPEGIWGGKAWFHLKHPSFGQIPTYFKGRKNKSKKRDYYLFNEPAEVRFFLGILLKVLSSWKCGWRVGTLSSQRGKKKTRIGSLITLKPYVQHMSAVTESFRKNNYKTSASDFKGVLKGPKFWSLNFCPSGKSDGDYLCVCVCLFLWIVLLRKTNQRSLPYKKTLTYQSWLPPWNCADPSTHWVSLFTSRGSVLKPSPAFEKWLYSRTAWWGSVFPASPGFNMTCALFALAKANGVSISSRDQKFIVGWSH